MLPTYGSSGAYFGSSYTLTIFYKSVQATVRFRTPKTLLFLKPASIKGFRIGMAIEPGLEGA